MECLGGNPCIGIQLHPVLLRHLHWHNAALMSATLAKNKPEVGQCLVFAEQGRDKMLVLVRPLHWDLCTDGVSDKLTAELTNLTNASHSPEISRKNTKTPEDGSGSRSVDPVSSWGWSYRRHGTLNWCMACHNAIDCQSHLSAHLWRLNVQC